MDNLIYKIKTLPDYRTQYEFCGALTEILYMKKAFRYNRDIADIIYNVYGIEFKKYVISSRSLLIGKFLKEIINNKYDNYKTKKISELILAKIKYTNIINSKTIKSRKDTSDDIQKLIKEIASL